MLIITYIRFHRHYPSIQHDRNFSYLAHPPSTRHDQSYRSWLIMFSLKGYSFLYQNGAKIFIRYHFILHLQIWPPLVVKFLTSEVWKVCIWEVFRMSKCKIWPILQILINYVFVYRTLFPWPIMHLDFILYSPKWVVFFL